MKKLLVGLLALSAVTAMADHHEMDGHKHTGKELKHMVRFFGFEDGGNSNSFDVSLSDSDNGTSETKETNIAINYAYAITQNWQVGLTYKSNSGETKTSGGTTDNGVNAIGLSGYYNWGKSIDSTCYVGLHYTTMNATEDGGGTIDGITFAKDDSATQIALEYGHRFHVGHIWGLHLTYAPSLTYSMTTFEDDSADEDLDSTALAWNWIKFDLLF